MTDVSANDIANTQELDEKFPNRPRNHGSTFPFHYLYTQLFDPLNENRKRPTGPKIARRKQGPNGPSGLPPHEVRRTIIERFISRWRKEVGNDIYPAFRLIIPDKDRERAMYGLKEKAIGKLLVKMMKITNESADGQSLLNWKLPGFNAGGAGVAGDFAGRCFEVIFKRPMRTEPGDLNIGEVNILLDRLSAAQKEEQQLPIFEQFYSRMNSQELLWLIRIILRQMKVGATERTFFDIWHPDAESLFNVSSSLRRVCWELWDTSIRLGGEDRGVTLMQCFQPQLAQFQMHSFKKMVERMRPVAEDRSFWIEEKLDGERMQLHMVLDKAHAGGKRFTFWSRKAKNYNYLYGDGLLDDNSALTRHLVHAFAEGVNSIILDGEMITWDPEQDAIVPFGTLKTAAISEQKNPFANTGQRPLYRVFDILFLNGIDLTMYTLRDRRKALEDSVKSVTRRLEIHPYTEAFTADEIEPHLRKVVAEASEGLVLKNPRSPYKLNDRNDDWMKVKPEYMTEFGESLDCIVIGGYYGSGRRGGNLSSFLCGLKVDESQIRQGADPMKCYSFFKVGGGFAASDYAAVRHHTEGHWIEWDSKKPPRDLIELGGGDLQYERPDVWIRPSDSVVLSVKAASVNLTDQFRLGFTLRFPRLKRIRLDRDWKSALSIQGFLDLKANVDKEHKEKEFQVESNRRKRVKLKTKKPLIVAGNEQRQANQIHNSRTDLFAGLTFYVLTESATPPKKSKAELEDLIKSNGGRIVQTHNAIEGTICIADRRVVKVAALEKAGKIDLIRPSWITDFLDQAATDGSRTRYFLPFEPKHIFFTTKGSAAAVEATVDKYGDSFVRDTTVSELRLLFDRMPPEFVTAPRPSSVKDNLEERGTLLDAFPARIFHGYVIYNPGPRRISSPPSTCFKEDQALRLQAAIWIVSFAGAEVTHDEDAKDITHVLINPTKKNDVRRLRMHFARRDRLPHLVTLGWVEQSWKEKTLLGEERFAP
ncbi:DNA ligase (ATP) [Agyrium rufum]|nr:DNA ligase (ATP) [Agyrium rufum]